MIRSHADFLAYLEADRLALGRSSSPPFFLLQDPVWYFQRLLRRCEYLKNCATSWWYLPEKIWRKYQFKAARIRLKFHIPLNSTGPALALMHEGDILIHEEARIGSHARINIGVVIGMNPHENVAPQIGNHVTIEPGAKIFGAIHIADWTHIGANAVVNRSISEPGQIVAGVPVRFIKPNPKYPGQPTSG